MGSEARRAGERPWTLRLDRDVDPGRPLAQARWALECGTPFVSVNLATALCDGITWDCHADGFCLNSTLEDYRTQLAPAFDEAFSRLLEDLRDSGLLDSTLVIAQGE